MARRRQGGTPEATESTEPVGDVETGAAVVADEAVDPIGGPVAFRYIGSGIEHFFHKGRGYQLIPRTIYRNLPSEAPQVRTLYAAGKLELIKE